MIHTEPRGPPYFKIIQLVSRYQRPCSVHLALADDGPGVPRDLRARIFEPGFSTKQSGWGIGLPVPPNHSCLKAKLFSVNIAWRAPVLPQRPPRRFLPFKHSNTHQPLPTSRCR